MKTVTTKVYAYDELSDKAKEKAQDWYREVFSAEDEWWESTYDDAERVHLKITSFDTDRGNKIDGEFLKNAEDTAKAIIGQHGQEAETYKTADKFLADLSTLESEFLKSILEEYLSMLRKEYEYQNSDEVIAENVRANEYTFTADGKRFG